MDGFLNRLRTSLKRGRSVTLPEDPKAASRVIVSTILRNEAKTLEDLLNISTLDLNTTFHRTKRTYAMAAAQVDAYECLCLLLKRGCDPTQSDVSGNTPFIVACHNGHRRCAKKLAACKNVDINSRDSTGYTGLHWLAVSGRVNALQDLMEYITDINCTTSNGYTYLAAAAKNGHNSTVQLLLKHGADINIQTDRGDTPLHLACKGGLIHQMRTLLEYKPKNLPNNNGEYPLQVAVDNEHYTLAVELINTYRLNNQLVIEIQQLTDLVTTQVDEKKIYGTISAMIAEDNGNAERFVELLCNHADQCGLGLFSTTNDAVNIRSTLKKCIGIVKRLLEQQLVPKNSGRLLRQSLISSWGLLEGWLNAHCGTSLDAESPVDDDDEALMKILPQICTSIEVYYIVSTLEEDGGSGLQEFLRFVSAHESVIEKLIKRQPDVIFEYFIFIMENQDIHRSLFNLAKIQSFEARKDWFYESLHTYNKQLFHSESIEELLINREALFRSSCHQLLRRDPHDLKHLLSITFKDEEGMGSGVLKEWFDSLSSELMNPDYGLFTPSPDGVTFQPNTSSYVNPDHLNYFNFAGQIIGLAIYHKQLINAYFTRSFYKHMLGIRPSYRDIESIDAEYYRNLCWILDNDITDLGLDLTFCVEALEFGVVRMVNLKPAGNELPVTEQNKREYVQLVTDLKMSESIMPQITSFNEGFRKYIPEKLIKVFDEYELEILLSGIPEINMDDWIENTNYIGYSEDDQIIKWFWEVVKEFDDESRVQLLQFTTGSSRVPFGGFSCLPGGEDQQKFTISTCPRTNGLPSASNCVNMLMLPSYSTKDELKSKLKTAMLCSSGFHLP